MANTRKYLNHLLQNTGITPACSEEERAAADIVADIFKNHGFQPEIQEFNASSGDKMAQAVYGILVFVGAILAGIGGAVGLVGLLLALLGAVLHGLERMGKPMLSRFGSGGLSQNVIAYHKASGPLASPRNRPVVVVAHYDSPRADLLAQAPFAAYRPLLVKLLPFAMLIPAAVAVACLFPIPAVAKTALWVVSIVVALVPLTYSVAILANKFVLPYTSGSVCNKSSVAAMLGVMDAVAPYQGENEFPRDKPFAEFMDEQRSFIPADDEFADYRDDDAAEFAGDAPIIPKGRAADEPVSEDSVRETGFEVYESDEPVLESTTTMTRDDLIAAGLNPVSYEDDDRAALLDGGEDRGEFGSVSVDDEASADRVAAEENVEPAAEPAAEPASEPALPRNAAGNLRYGADIIRALGMVADDCAFSYAADALPVPPAPAAPAPVEPAAYSPAAPAPAPARTIDDSGAAVRGAADAPRTFHQREYGSDNDRAGSEARTVAYGEHEALPVDNVYSEPHRDQFTQDMWAAPAPEAIEELVKGAAEDDAVNSVPAGGASPVESIDDETAVAADNDDFGGVDAAYEASNEHLGANDLGQRGHEDDEDLESYAVAPAYQRSSSIYSQAYDAIDVEAPEEEEQFTPIVEDTSDYILEAEWEVIEDESEGDEAEGTGPDAQAEVSGDAQNEEGDGAQVAEEGSPVADLVETDDEDRSGVIDRDNASRNEDGSSDGEVAGTVSLDVSELDGATAVFEMTPLEKTAVFGGHEDASDSEEGIFSEDQDAVSGDLDAASFDEHDADGESGEFVDEPVEDIDDGNDSVDDLAEASGVCADESQEDGASADGDDLPAASVAALDASAVSEAEIAEGAPRAEAAVKHVEDVPRREDGVNDTVDPASVPAVEEIGEGTASPVAPAQNSFGQTVAMPAIHPRQQPETVDSLMAQIDPQPAPRPQRTLNIPSIGAADHTVPRQIPSVPGIESLQRQQVNRTPLFDLPDPSVKPSDPFASPASATSAATRGFSVVEGPSKSGRVAASTAEAEPGQREAIGKIEAPAPKEKPRRGLGRLFGKKKHEDSMSDWLGVDDDFDAKRTGGEIGSWDNFDDDPGWKGGATGAPGTGEDELKDAITSMGDDELFGHDIWFVATGASECGNAGMNAFLDTHRDKLRGVFLINLECVGSGQVVVLSTEGEQRVLKGDKRIMKLVRRVSADFHHEFGAVDMPFLDTDAYAAMSRSLRSLTIAGVDGSHFACSHSEEDQPYNVDEDNVSLVADVVTEVIRRS